MSEATTSPSKYTPGAFVWRELMTGDVERAKGFFGELFGWRFVGMPMGDFEYVMIHAGDTAIGGVMPMGPESGHPPHWMSYVSVDDVDARAAVAKERGGTVAVGPMDIPNVGRFAVIGDPDGAYFTLFRSLAGDPVAAPAAHTFCWETLVTKDVAKAQEFYGAVVGWQSVAGPNGIPTFARDGGKVVLADVQAAQTRPPSWATYVAVADLGATTARAAKLGATIAVPRIDIENVGAIAFLADPTGAFLGVFESKMAG